jgi:uncharacterized RDD family membrane protein YckC
MIGSEDQDGKQDKVDSAIAEYLEAVDLQSPFDLQQWLNRHQEIRSELMEFLATESDFGTAMLPKQLHDFNAAELTTDWARGTMDSQPQQPFAVSIRRSKIGPYVLKRLLGAGGMGQVYEASDPSGNLVAVKLLSSRWMRSEESLLRFKQEGEIASTINHPRCVFVRAADEDQGQPYIVMELMTGKTLKDLSSDSGQLDVNDAIRAIMDVLDGLEEAHSHGMVHRDIKPANCYLESNGRVKLGDFGLARSMVHDSELTQTGDFVGTPLFASPEQVKGLSIDSRTDIYSVCATLYFLLTGKAPFAGSSPTSVIARIVSEDPTPVRALNPKVPALLESVIMRGLQRDRAARQQSVGELRLALEPFATGRQTISTWGRRFAAYGLDSTLAGLTGAVAVQFISVDTTYPAIPLWLFLSLMFPMLVYYLVFEIWGNATLGKRLLRLHVVDRYTGEKPSLSKRVVRTISALLFMGMLSDLTLYAWCSPNDHNLWAVSQWTGYMVLYILMLSPWLCAWRPRLLLHDWISGTTVVDRPSLNAQQQLASVAAVYDVPLLASTGYPDKLGDFKVTGLISTCRSGTILAGRDERLARDVWIQLRPQKASDLTTERRNCDRTTRLRWLSCGVEGDWRWDAFLAFKGAPLKHWTAPDSPLAWKKARSILIQIAEEQLHGEQDGTSVSVKSLDQIWIDSRGRVVIVDWHHLDQAETEQEETAVQQQRSVLRETARLLLCGNSLPLVSLPKPILAILPGYARKILEPLSTVTTASFSASTFLESLNANSRRPAELNFENRLLGVGGAAVPALMMLAIVASLSRAGNLLTLEILTDQLVAPSVVEWLLESGNEKEWERAKAKVEAWPSREQLQSWLENRQQRTQDLSEQYRVRFERQGSFAALIAQNANLIPEPVSQLPAVRFEWENDKLVLVNWRKTEGRYPFDLQLVSRMIAHDASQPSQAFFRRSPTRLVAVMLAPFFIWMIWAGLTRGGFAMWISGQQVVNAVGTPIPWYIWMCRVLVAGAPFLLLQCLVAWLDLYHPEYLLVSSIASLVMLWLFLVYSILVLAFPRRAPHDWLLGLYLVPR